MATVLVTGVGGASGVGAVKSLHAETDYEVVGVDMKPDSAGIRLADRGTTVPGATDETWPDAIADVVDRFDVDVMVPTVDEELARLPVLSERLNEDVPIVAPRQDVIDVSLDKYATAERLADAGLEVPSTWLGSNADEVDSAHYPLLVKPRRGRGSRGVARLEDESELEAYLDRTTRSLDDLLVQAYVDGVEYTSSVVVTHENRLLSVVPKEAIEKDGSTVLGATRRASAVSASCRALFDALKPAGPLNVQQIVDETGTPYTIEINPRFSSTSCLTAAAGVNEFDLLVRDALGESVDAVDDYVADRYIIRYQDHLFADADELDQFE
jgi:carbamoyl-phosphate synthase large subunit